MGMDLQKIDNTLVSENRIFVHRKAAKDAEINFFFIFR